MVITGSFLQGFEAARDVEALMERMRQLQESLLRDEGASQEEMENRFELEKTESLLVTPSGTGSQAPMLGAAASLFTLLMGADASTRFAFPFQEVLSTGLVFRLAFESWSVSASGLG